MRKMLRQAVALQCKVVFQAALSKGTRRLMSAFPLFSGLTVVVRSRRYLVPGLSACSFYLP